ncbi:MAG: signal recognition particle-docking protein FtsY [Pseudomonadota bacterium]
MFGFGKKKADEAAAEKASLAATQSTTEGSGEATPPEPLKSRLAKSRGGFGTRLRQLFSFRKAIDDELFEELETLLLTADVGAEATTAIINELTARAKRQELSDAERLTATLRELLTERLTPVARPLEIDGTRRPHVIMVVGVNGAGKTTTIGKLGQRLRAAGHSVTLAAGDTFRAAAVEQLKTWGERIDAPVVAQPTGSDAASVVFDALHSARSRETQVLIADTAGRLHTQSNLMEELKKIRRVMGKLDPEAPHEVLLVLDGTAGQNAISQALEFTQAVGVTGLVVTKLDGTAKGGVVFGLAERLGLPIRFIGVGEKAEDLRVFEPEAFVDALL